MHQMRYNENYLIDSGEDDGHARLAQSCTGPTPADS